MKDDGARNDLLERLAADPAFRCRLADMNSVARAVAVHRAGRRSRWTSSCARSSSRSSRIRAGRLAEPETLRV